MRFSAVLLIAAMATVSACAPSKDEIESQSKTVTQQIVDENPSLKGLGISVDRVDAIKEDGNKYRGIAQVTLDGERHQVPISILADGDKILVTTEGGAFTFATAKAAAKALEAEPPSAEIQEMIRNGEELNDQCKGGPGDDPKTADFCEHRDAVYKDLKANGWCYQTKTSGAPLSDAEWMHCKA